MSADNAEYDAFFLDHLQSVQGDAAWYVNQSFIGKGGNGTTFFVTCTSGENHGVHFALKVFHRVSDDQRRKRFLGEIRHYRSLSHPSMVKVYDEGTFKAKGREYPFAVMDYVPENLESKLGRGVPRLSRYQVLRYLMNVASGAAYLHSRDKPIVHRDIKPANILINGPSARLGDLGLAKVLMGEENDSPDEVSAYIAMPYFYRTPELVALANGEKVSISPASDIYQLGLVLYRALTGFNPQRPPEKDAREKIMLDVRNIAGVCGKELTELITSMLAERPERRPTARQVLDYLNKLHKEVCVADYAATGVAH